MLPSSREQISIYLEQDGWLICTQVCELLATLRWKWRAFWDQRVLHSTRSFKHKSNCHQHRPCSKPLAYINVAWRSPCGNPAAAANSMEISRCTRSDSETNHVQKQQLCQIDAQFLL